MKNLNILQSGGGVFYSSVANPYSNAAIADQQVAASSKSSSKDEGLIPKDLMNKLSEKGIPTDVNKFMNMLADFEHKSNFGMGINKRQLYRLQAYANQIIKQSEYLDAAEKRAEQNGALDEFAVDARGYLYIPGEDGKINKIHASKFDATKHTALTVGELLQQRKFNPNEVDNESIATTVGNNIGIEKINDYIQGIIQAVGTSENSSEAYVSLGSILGKEAARRPNEGQMEALKDLYQLTQQIGSDAIFKVKDQYKSKNIDAAMSYIMSMLPNNIKTQLVARNVAAGGKYENSNKYAAEIIGMAAMSANDTKMSQGIDYDASINKAAAGQESSNQHRNLKSIEVLVQGSLGKTDYHLTSSKNPNLSMTLHGTTVGALSNYDNNIIPKAPLSLALQNSIGPLIDKQHVTMGNQKISESLFDTILYDGNDVLNTWAPVDQNGDIDLNALQMFNELLSIFDSDPSLTTADKNRILQQQGIQGRINEDGSFTGYGNMAQFLVFTGITSSEVINSDNVFADEIKDTRAELDQIERIYSSLKKKESGMFSGIEFKKGTGLFNWSADLYRAPIFMKLKPTAQIQVGTYANHGPVINTPGYQDLVTMDQMRHNQQHQTTPIYQPSSSILLEE